MHVELSLYHKPIISLLLGRTNIRKVSQQSLQNAPRSRTCCGRVAVPMAISLPAGDPWRPFFDPQNFAVGVVNIVVSDYNML